MSAQAVVARPAASATGPFDDLRSYIDALRAAGEVIVVDSEVDWDLEIGAFSRLALERELRPVWFRKIKDYPGHTAFAHLVPNLRCGAIALGLPADTPVDALRREYLRRSQQQIPPVEVASGPCQTHVVRGDAVDLTEIPAPMLHDGDGGRYAGSWDLVVSEDPDTHEVNWGVYRFLLHDRRTLSGVPRYTSGLGTVLREKHVPRGTPMPIAIVIGADPLSHLAAAGRGPEPGAAGGLRGAPVRVVKCVTNDLRVPADAQMVIEGVALTDAVAREGPYGEYTAYRTADGDHGIVVRVDAITYRDDPIHTVDCTGWRASLSALGIFGMEIAWRKMLEARGVPVVDVSAPMDFGMMGVFASVERGGAEVARAALDVLEEFALGASKMFLFDRDVDVRNMDDVMHAIVMRLHPERGIHVRSHVGRAKPLQPFLSREERALPVHSASIVIDCTWPSDWDRMQDIPAKGFFEDNYSDRTKARVRALWEELRRS